MELRRTEEEVNSIAAGYETLRRMSGEGTGNGGSAAIDPSLLLPLAKLRQRAQGREARVGDGGYGGGDGDGEMDERVESSVEVDVKMALAGLESLRNRTAALGGKADRFRKRLGEKDPVTDAPRYGEKTAARVTAMLETYDALRLGIGIAFGEGPSEGSSAGASGSGGGIAGVMRRMVREEEEAAARIRMESVTAAEEESKQREKEERAREERRKAEEEDAAEAKRSEDADLRRRAEEARREREEREAAEVRAAREADRRFVASIRIGPGGVREQLAALRDGTASDSKARAAAFGALHTIFSQIAAHPEEIKFRRIRRDHPKFNEDIGRHPGGKEMLVAAGFKLETLDGVPCFFSKEPDIEHDMDGWSDWFNSLKSTLEIVEEEMMK